MITGDKVGMITGDKGWNDYRRQRLERLPAVKGWLGGGGHWFYGVLLFRCKIKKLKCFSVN